MKFSYFVYILLLIEVVSSDELKLKNDIKRVEKECQNSQPTHVDESQLRRFIQGAPTTATNLGAHYLCANVKLGIQNEHGDINKEKVRESLRETMSDENQVNEIVNKCSVRAPGESAGDSAMVLIKCLHSHSPNRISLHHENHSKQRNAEFKKARKECQSDVSTHVDEDALDKLRKGKIVDWTNLGAHIFCMNKKINIQQENGDISDANKEVIKRDLEDRVDDESKVKDILEECSERTAGDSAIETAIKLYKCLHKNAPDANQHGSRKNHQRSYKEEAEQRKDRNERFRKSHEECMSNPATHVDADLLDKLRQGETIDESKVAEHILCMNIGTNIQDSKGNINKETIRKDLELKMDDIINKIVEDCGRREHGDSAAATAVKVFKCLHKAEVLEEHGHHGHEHE